MFVVEDLGVLIFRCLDLWGQTLDSTSMHVLPLSKNDDEGREASLMMFKQNADCIADRIHHLNPSPPLIDC